MNIADVNMLAIHGTAGPTGGWPIATWAAEAVVFACLVAAAGIDIMDRIIPNRLVVAVMIAGFALRLLTSPGTVWLSLAVYAVALGMLGVLASWLLVGWGDVKLIAAVTLLAPPQSVVPLLLAITLAGGVLACVYLAARHVLRRSASSSGQQPAVPLIGLAGILDKERARILADEPMPYAVAILGGAAYHLAIETMRW
jgi:prepilin peptidase CpaA